VLKLQKELVQCQRGESDGLYARQIVEWRTVMRHTKLVGYDDCIVKLAVNTDWSLTGVPDEEVGPYLTITRILI
jgi:hypothetical protein